MSQPATFEFEETGAPPRADRTPHGPLRPVRRRDVGAVQLLRDAGPAGPLPDQAPEYARTDALALYATYTGLVYLTPLLGGFLADKFLGQRKAILIGGIVMALGHFAMAFEPLLYLALGLLILGNGFFKPNISTMVGNLYPQGDARRDGAYTIFYMGINLGAFFSPLVCGMPRREPGSAGTTASARRASGWSSGLISFLVVPALPGRRLPAGPRGGRDGAARRDRTGSTSS